MPSALSGLMELAEAPVQGPSPSFDRARFLLAFLAIGASGSIGRGALAKSAGLGEGAVRTVLKRLRESGYARVDASGCHLTASGTAAYRTLRHALSDPLRLDGSHLTIGNAQTALAVRGAGSLVKKGLEQRDSAVMAGAEGATTYVVKGGKFTIPGGSSDCESDFPSPAWTTLRDRLKPRDDDAIVLCGASDETKAILGALSAALTLI
ncbi:MAG TPA: DUF4443 domain-containing protein [Nitrososphaerales archaeon]|nr:DUF4443 domain-containing protein [Nitrososphaerales archaeon]